MKIANFIAQHRKIIVFLIGNTINALVMYYSGNPEVTGWLNLAILILTGLGVYQASNKPITTVAK